MATCMAWMALGFYVANKTSASLRARNYQQTSWGPGQEQHPPTASSKHARRIPLERTRANAHLEFDNQQAGLVNYSRYRVRFEGVYRFTNPVDHQQEVVIVFPLPSLANHYDDMEFLVNGAPQAFTALPQAVAVSYAAAAHETLEFCANYQSRGRDRWAYAFLQEFNGPSFWNAKDF